MSRVIPAHFFCLYKGSIFLRNISLDLMRLILAFMVVGIHTSFLAEFSEPISYMLTQGLFRIAVPIFFIVNGYYFSVALDSGSAKAWLAKIAALYSVWMILYSHYWFYLGEASLFDLAKIAHTIIFGYFHLWYLPATIGAAAMVYFCRKLSSMAFFILLVGAFSVGVLTQYLGNYHVVDYLFFDKILNMGWVYRNFIFYGLPFFGVGYLLARNLVESKITFNQSVIVSVIGICCIFLESYFNYCFIGKSEGFDLLLSLAIASPAIFILFKKINFMGHSKWLSFFASGIYFVHPLVIYFLWGYGFRATTLTLVTISCSIISAAGLVIINKRFKFFL